MFHFLPYLYGSLNTNKMKNTNKPGTKLNEFIKAFKVYKTERYGNNWVTILIPVHEFNDNVLQFKINNFLSLGYKVELI